MTRYSIKNVLFYNAATRKRTAKGVVSSMCVPVQNPKDSGTVETKSAESRLQKSGKKRKRHGIYLDNDAETEMPASKHTPEHS